MPANERSHPYEIRYSSEVYANALFDTFWDIQQALDALVALRRRAKQYDQPSIYKTAHIV